MLWYRSGHEEVSLGLGRSLAVANNFSALLGLKQLFWRWDCRNLCKRGVHSYICYYNNPTLPIDFAGVWNVRVSTAALSGNAGALSASGEQIRDWTTATLSTILLATRLD